MTIKETTQILFMLSAYYGQGKANPKLMAVAWHAILQGYDFGIAQEAVIAFARNDTREYASFPSPGAIIQAIEDRLSVRNGIINARLTDKPYRELEARYTEVINQSEYERIGKEQIELNRQVVFQNLLPKAKTELLITD